MSNSYEVDIWNAVKAKLVAAQVAGQPLAYVAATSLFEGLRPIPVNCAPAIVMEPGQTVDQFFLEPNGLKALHRLMVFCIVNHAVVSKAILGDATQQFVGILDLASAVKNVLQADQKLGGASGGRITKVRFPLTQYVPPSADYPMREAHITVEVEVQLTTTTR